MTNLLSKFTGEISLEDAPAALIEEVQTELTRIGFRLNVDGDFGPKTSAAFNQFKADNFLARPGVLGESTAKALLKALAVPKTKDDHINLILMECRKQGILLATQQAYVVATTQHETAHTFRPISEYGGARMRYAPYYGRGYTQLTWLDNYRKYSPLTGKNLVQFPDQAKEPFTAAFIMVHGFRTGGFTGRAITQYINNSHTDFIHARKCINGMDKAQLIAGYAEQWVEGIKRFG